MSAPPGFSAIGGLRNIAGQTLFQPLLTGPLLAYILRLVPQIPFNLLPDFINQFAPYINRSKAASILAALFSFGVLKRANSFLTDRAVNNWITDNYDWSKEIVVVTGGSSGIGELVCKDLGRRGINLVIIDIMPPKYPLPSTSHFFKCDLSKATEISSTCETIRLKIGHPTILFNNAGIASGKTLLDTPPAEYQRMFSINTISHFLLVREFVPAMIKNNHGHIITMASMASFVTIAWNVSYSQSKSSALAFHEGLTQELRHIYGAPKIRTSIFHPTWVYTPLTEHMTKLNAWKEMTLKAEDVAKEIVDTILSGKSRGQVCLPEGYVLGKAVKAFPGWIQEGFRDLGAKVGKSIMEEGGQFALPPDRYNFDD